MSLLPATPLTDGVVTLRPWTNADIPWLVECMKDPEIPRWTRIPADFDETKAKAMVARITDFTQRLWLAVIDVGTGRPLGSVCIGRCNVPPPYESPDCLPDEFGFFMCKEARNKGITTRASVLLIDYAFSVLRRPCLHMTIKDGNGPSLRVAQKLHFKQFSELKKAACGESAPTTIFLFRRDAPHICRVPAAGLTDGVVRLRPWRSGDTPWLLECMKDPEISKWTRIPYPYTEEHAKEFAAMQAEWARTGHHVVLAIEEVASGHLVGGVGLHRIDLSGPYAMPDFLPNELGYYLHKAERHRGFASRAAKLVCDFAFSVLLVPEINMGIKEGNAASLRLAERLGFVNVGHERKAIGAGPETGVVMLKLARH